MKISYENAIYPARLAYKPSRDQAIACEAHQIIDAVDGRGQYYSGHPTPNKSARVVSRKRRNNSVELITLEISQGFYQSLAEWVDNGLKAERGW